MRNKILLAHLALISVNLIYAANHLLAKGVTPEHIGPNGFIIIRMGVATVLFFIVYLAFIREKIDKKDIPLLFLTGLFGIGASQILFLNGIAYTSAMNVGVLMTTIPIITVILSYFFLKERITKLKGIGVIVGGIGAIALAIVGKTAQYDSTFGDIMIVSNAFLFAAYLVLVKPLMKKYNPLTVITYNFIFGYVFILLYPPAWEELLAASFSQFPMDIWLKIGFIILFATFITYLFNVFSLKHLTPSVTGSYVYTQPAFVIMLTFVFATIGWTENFIGAITLGKVTFMLMIFLGVYLISFSAKIERKKKKID